MGRDILCVKCSGDVINAVTRSHFALRCRVAARPLSVSITLDIALGIALETALDIALDIALETALGIALDIAVNGTYYKKVVGSGREVCGSGSG